MIAEQEIRRPGITNLAERIQRENPRWSQARVLSHAKVLYTEKEIFLNGRRVKNPDYKGGRP